MHHHHRHKLLIALSTTTPCKFSTIDLVAPQDGLTSVCPLPFEASHENVWIIESVCGLVCLCRINKCNEREYYCDIILWNPLTGEYKTTSRPNNEECYVTTTLLFGLYYIYNDYRLLLVTKDLNVYIYSLKSDSWRKVDMTHDDLNTKISAKGNLIIIKRFDMKMEKWRKIIGPYIGYGLWKWCLCSMVVRGYIHLYMKYYHLQLNDDGKYIGLGNPVTGLWRMDGDGDGDVDWTKLVTTYNPSKSPHHWYMLYSLHLTKSGKWVMHDKYFKELHEADLEMRTKKEKSFSQMAAKDSKLKNLVVVSDHESNGSDEDDVNEKETETDLGFCLDKLNLGPKKKLLVIPFGGMIVHRAHRHRPKTIPRNRRPDFSSGNFMIYKRPFCEEFLKFCFERFEVGMWSSAMELDQEECTDTGYKCANSKYKPLFLKELKYIWQKKYSYLPWKDGEYSSSNTLLIANPANALLNPPNTSISPKDYDPNNKQDDFLGPNGELRAFLDGVAEASDVPSYVKSHPFGEPAITPSHFDWKHYVEIIREYRKEEETAD
ncbi:hypothetical protein OSB04_013786 [Centaurea solstitialis]|uniref:Mitochondrial import inner membrane translocase subunit TIM50 n=1 Tax=Centaurea solstitialis TaxID=347529 RepID=A0AA38WFT5_9ASTR|nr:hypothetical protein OSB04_013786 [Centaurea solstitialis]